MKRKSKKLVQMIGEHVDSLNRIELIVHCVDGMLRSVPAVSYKVVDNRGQIVNGRVVCGGYLGFGKWKVRSVASEVWAYYQSQNIDAKVTDLL